MCPVSSYFTSGIVNVAPKSGFSSVVYVVPVAAVFGYP
jgi:hypothetical protein